MFQKINNKGITLIALVITIIILLILAGITIATLGGENGLLTRATQARQAQLEAEMKEQLTLALKDLQIEKLGDATLDDVTQEWIDSKIQDYECTVKEDASISGKRIIMEKNGVICKFLIDENLNSTVIEESESESEAQLEYEAVSRDGENVKILITITETENGLQQVEFPDGTILYCNGEKEVAKDYEVQLGVEYVVKITSKDGQVKEETILVNDYYHKITKNLDEGISIDNAAIKAAYNKPYQATITSEDEYIIDAITVTMGGEAVTVDTTTGVINIEKVTGDIEITSTAKKLEIVTTTPIINTSSSATSSLEANTQTIGTTLYINFSATLEGMDCTIEPSVPYAVTSNGKYKFRATGTYQNKTITKEIELTVNQYEIVSGFVQYDAGEWTEEEINKLENGSLYNINTSKTVTAESNLTFGGFTYKGDTTNESYINDGTVITTRNQSVAPESGYGTPTDEGWKILSTTVEDGKTYVTELIHAGSPENFTYNYYTTNSNEAKNIFTSSRNWDMYKDKELDNKGYIEKVYIMGEEIQYIPSSVRTTGAYYWIASSRIYSSKYCLCYIKADGGYRFAYNMGIYACIGIRPIVSLSSGVYVASGSGTEEDPYILTKE